ncbi:hypothetical protein HTZ84_22385 [Haloterrigena sp. SYSU A558-1]|uniref:Uncharacterized protein n=1 Tax=Haloterrigena gelatinilytica TaxID=2741724 RepID=A0ABX2LQ39_9EURY|nr:hypothetical protein [Haloterrigena gelatinilytica]NUC75016.1 hypothetical protein [Haloterrigena gelatinilytica]
MSFETDGFDELQDRLEGMKEGGEELEGENKISFDGLFTTGFMQKYTDFESFGELLEESQWDVESEDDFLEIPDDEFDVYIAERTTFESWEQMYGKAAENRIGEQLGF